MRLTTVILIATIMQVSASGFAQKISLLQKNAPLNSVLKEIRKQSGYNFIITGNLFKESRPVSIEVNQMELSDVLALIFNEQPLTYTIENKTVVIKEREKTFFEDILSRFKVIDIQGKVVDSAGTPLSGATIKIKGTNRVTRTDVNGEFTLGNVDEKAILIISYLGYESKEINVAKDLGTIELIVSTGNLEEVNVMMNTGYQTLSKERVTGSFEQIDNQKLNQRVGTDILGRLEGLSSIAFDKITTRPTITVRGMSSIENNSNPLIVLDNFPYEGKLENINPNDVENVTILKDAAAASIWGTRAGNGVIVITTKKGKLNQRLHLEFNANLSLKNKPDLSYIKQISTSDLIDLEKLLFSEGYYSSSENSESRPALSSVVETLIAQREGDITIDQANQNINALRNIDGKSDFNKYVYRNGINQQYALTARGGSENVTYLFSGGFDKNLSELDAKYNRINLRAVSKYIPVKHLEITTNMTYTQSKNGSGQTGFGGLAGLRPYDKLADENGNPLPFNIYRKQYTDTAGSGKLLDWTFYPLEDYKHNNSEINLQSILTSLAVRYQVFNGLHAGINYQYEKQNSNSRKLQGVQSFFARDLINKFTQINSTTGIVQNIVPVGGIIDDSEQDLQSHSLRGQLNYDHSWKRHQISAIVGAEVRDIRTLSNSDRVYGYNKEISTVGNVDFVNSYTTYIRRSKEYIPQSLGLGENNNHYLSQYINFAYTYDSRYTITASARKDASNLFGVNTNDKWQPLWSSGLAWNISNEEFYSSALLPVLRLRATYGVSGNVDQSKSGVTTITYSRPAMYTNYPLAIVTQYANPDLRWEKTSMLNIGLDFSSNKSVVSGSLEYYNKLGTDLFGNAPIDPTAGLGSTVLTKNVANMKGQGIEIVLNATLPSGKFKWLPNLIFNYNKNKITEYYQTDFTASTYVSDGNIVSALKDYPVYSILSFQWAGLDASGNPQGILDGQKSIDYNAIMSGPLESLKYNGSATPTVFGAFNNMVSWKGFGLSASISYKLGYYFRRSSVNYSELLNMNFLGQGTADYTKRWQNLGDEQFTDVPSFVYPNNSDRSSFYQRSAVLVEKADHIRLQFVNFSYDLNIKRTNTELFQMQLFLNASNLGILWRANKYDLDPDYSSDVIPSPKSISFGIRAKL